MHLEWEWEGESRVRVHVGLGNSLLNGLVFSHF